MIKDEPPLDYPKNVTNVALSYVRIDEKYGFTLTHSGSTMMVNDPHAVKRFNTYYTIPNDPMIRYSIVYQYFFSNQYFPQNSMKENVYYYLVRDKHYVCIGHTKR
jgi:hypothetical protein